MKSAPDAVGLIPAAGKATRINPLPCSKEIYPVGYFGDHDELRGQPKPVCLYLLEQFRSAGVDTALIVINREKTDILRYLGDGSPFGMNLAYVVDSQPQGVPFSLDRAYKFIKDKQVLLGFPDIIMETRDPFTALLKKLAEADGDIALGLIPVSEPQKWDMVDLTEGGKVRDIVIKREQCRLKHAWVFTAWAPTFTEYLHRILRESESAEGSESGDRNRELQLSNIFLAAAEEGLTIETELFEPGFCVDIGTREGLKRTIKITHE